MTGYNKIKDHTKGVTPQGGRDADYYCTHPGQNHKAGKAPRPIHKAGGTTKGVDKHTRQCAVKIHKLRTCGKCPTDAIMHPGRAVVLGELLQPLGEDGKVAVLSCACLSSRGSVAGGVRL